MTASGQNQSGQKFLVVVHESMPSVHVNTIWIVPVIPSGPPKHDSMSVKNMFPTSSSPLSTWPSAFWTRRLPVPRQPRRDHPDISTEEVDPESLTVKTDTGKIRGE